MTALRRATVAALATGLATFAMAGCGSKASPRPSDAELASDAIGRSNIIMAQLALDDGGIPVSVLGPGSVVDGVVAVSAQFQTSYETSAQNYPLSAKSSVRIGDEAVKAEKSLRHLARLQSASDRDHHVAAWTPDEAARVIVVGGLVDAGLVPRTDLAGGFDHVSLDVTASPALDAWYSAHQSERLPGSSSLTIADEVSRALAVINAPQP